MGKQSRRASRRNRPQRQRGALSQGARGLTLVVATSPVEAHDGEFLEHDLQMVRSALLYADQVELLSPVANMVSGMAAIHAGGAEAWIDLFTALDDDVLSYMGVDGDPSEFRSLLGRYQQITALPRAERRAYVRKHGSKLNEARDAFQQHLRAEGGPEETLIAALERSGAAELAEAVDAGALTLNWEVMGSPGDADEMIERYADKLKELLAASDRHLLLDESMAGLARAMIDEGHVQPPDLTLSRAARSLVGTGLVSSLPVFPQATIGSILEARDELATPLAAYRGGVARLSGRLRSEPFDPSVESEVEDVWHDEVRPAVEHLREDLSKTRLAWEAATNLGIDVKTLSIGGGLFFGVERLTSVQEFTAAGIAAVPVLARAVASAHKEAADRRVAARRHEFFYLLELERRL